MQGGRGLFNPEFGIRNPSIRNGYALRTTYYVHTRRGKANVSLNRWVEDDLGWGRSIFTAPKTTLMRSVFFLAIVVLTSCGRSTPHYIAGYKTVSMVDSARIFNPGVANDHPMHFRPIDIDLWYPADSVADPGAPIEYGYFLGMLESRAFRYLGDPAIKGFTAQMASNFVEQLKCSDTSRLLHYKTSSYLDLDRSEGRFPLVIYLCSFNGMGYENVPFMEALVKEGYVVASVNSIGRYPGDMSTKKEDLMEQVKDAMAVYEHCKTDPGIDTGNVVVIGYSWGGLAAALFSPHIPSLKKVISLDGSEFHHYSGGSDEDKHFDSLRNYTPFRSLSIKVPYFRLEQSVGDTGFHEDSVYNFKEKLSSSIVSIQKVDGAEHLDFSSFRYIVNRSGNCGGKSLFIERVLQILKDKR